MQQPKEPAPKAEPQRHGTLLLKNKRRIVELQLGQAGLQLLKVTRVDGVNATEHHRLNFLETRQRLCRLAGVSDGVTHLQILRSL